MPKVLKNLAQKSSLNSQVSNDNNNDDALRSSPSKNNTAVRKCPLEQWNAKVSDLTFKSAQSDIKPCYSVLIQVVDQFEFQGQLL